MWITVIVPLFSEIDLLNLLRDFLFDEESSDLSLRLLFLSDRCFAGLLLREEAEAADF
jgi:hypothetical protein